MSSRKRAHQLVDQAADHAEALVEQVTPHVEAAVETVRERLHPAPKQKHRGRTLVRTLIVLGIAAAITARLRSRSGVESYQPPEAPAPDRWSEPAPEDLQRLDDEAPPPTPLADSTADSLSSFFSDAMDDTPQ